MKDKFVPGQNLAAFAKQWGSLTDEQKKVCAFLLNDLLQPYQDAAIIDRARFEKELASTGFTWLLIIH